MRTRLGEASGEEHDLWWHARAEDAVIDDVRRRLEQAGLPFLDRYSSREKILAEWHGRSESMVAGHPPRIVMAIILAEHGRKEEARVLLSQQVLETGNRGHPEYVRRLANQLGVGSVDD